MSQRAGRSATKTRTRSQNNLGDHNESRSSNPNLTFATLDVILGPGRKRNSGFPMSDAGPLFFPRHTA